MVILDDSDGKPALLPPAPLVRSGAQRSEGRNLAFRGRAPSSTGMRHSTRTEPGRARDAWGGRSLGVASPAQHEPVSVGLLAVAAGSPHLHSRPAASHRRAARRGGLGTVEADPPAGAVPATRRAPQRQPPRKESRVPAPTPEASTLSPTGRESGRARDGWCRPTGGWILPTRRALQRWAARRGGRLSAPALAATCGSPGRRDSVSLRRRSLGCALRFGGPTFRSIEWPGRRAWGFVWW